MQLYDLVEHVSSILTGNQKLAEYILDSSIDNGILRTSHKKNDTKIPDQYIDDTDTVIIAFKYKFDDSDVYYMKNCYGEQGTYVKLQLAYNTKNKSIEELIKLSKEQGYKYCYIIDLRNNTYEYRCEK